MSQASQRLAPWRPKLGARATDILARARERDARLDPNDHDIEVKNQETGVRRGRRIRRKALPASILGQDTFYHKSKEPR